MRRHRPPGDATSDYNAARNAFLSYLDAHLGIKHPTTVLIARLITEHFNQDHFNATGELDAYPSEARLSAKARIRDRAVRNQISLLKKLGIFEVRKGGGGGNNHYTAKFPDRNSTAGQTTAAERKPTAGQTVTGESREQADARENQERDATADRQPAADQEAKADRQWSAPRPEVERIQTGSELPAKSDDDLSTSERGGDSPPPHSVEAASTSVAPEVEHNDDESTCAPDGALDSSYRRGDRIPHPTTAGVECTIAEINGDKLRLLVLGTGGTFDAKLDGRGYIHPLEDEDQCPF
ncbi:MAG: hypothetical protein JJ913_08070 [Rhizobiaceae bacterium]|nr:hypothetical protein [Rhizobiaceae bacterium]